MDIDKIISTIWYGKEWIFSGIGVVVLGFIGKLIMGKKSGGNLDTYTMKSKVYDNNNVSGGNNIIAKKNQIIQNDNSNTISVEGNGNVAGYGNSVTNNFIYSNNDDKKKENFNSWFYERFRILLSLLNDARRFNEKEYTVEYVSSLIGLKNVDGLKVYLTQDKEPDDEFKKKFVDVFGVNEEWMVYGRGEFPFASNISFWGSDPMDILRSEDLKAVKKFIVVIGEVEGGRQACIIRQKNETCYELYPEYFTLYSHVGGTGTRQLVEFYRFLREAEKIKKLDGIAYVATEEQMEKLMRGEFSPKKVERFEVARGFIDDFMCISEAEIEKNKNFWDEEFILVQKIIASNISGIDRVNQEEDLKCIKKNLGEDFHMGDRSMIREANKNDLDEILQLYLYLHEKSIPEDSQHLRSTWDNIMNDANHHLIVCEIDGKIVASCVCVIISNLTRNVRPYAFVENVVTHREYRKKGYATACLNFAKKIAEENHCYKMMLLTGSKEESTLKFYRNAGYSSLDKTAFIQWIDM